MAMIPCPECGTRISDKARQCPHCGCQGEGGLVLLSEVVPAARPVSVVIPGAAVLDNGVDLINAEARARVAEFLMNAEEMARLAPGIYEAVKKMFGRGEKRYVADFSKKAEELLNSGELVFSVEKKTGDLLPQLRRVDNGQVYEKARIRIEDVPADLLPTVHVIQAQLNANELMRRIKDVSAQVGALRLEGQADRIAKANSVWAQLQQAALIQDARLRELKMLDIASDATEARCVLEENYGVQCRLLAARKGGSKLLGEAGNNALSDLAAIAMMSRTEYAAYCLLGEEGAAGAALGQLREFVAQSRLDDRETLLRINSFSTVSRESIVDGFSAVAEGVMSLELEGAIAPAGLLPAEEEDER